MADDEFSYSSGFGNEFATEAVEGALPVGPQLAAAGAARPVRRTAQRDRVHPAAGREPQIVGVPHPAEREAPRVLADRQQEPKGHAVRRTRTEPEPAALGPASAAKRRHAAGLHRRPVHGRGQRRHQDQSRDGHSPVRGQSLHARPLLRRLRRRAAARPRARRGHPAHRARPDAGQPRRDRRRPARHPLQGRADRRLRPRLPVRELRRELHPARARPDRRQRPGQRARLPVTRTRRSRSATTPSRW